MRIRLAIPERLVTPAALEAALEATTLANEEAFRRGELPSVEELISRGAKWRPEPFLDGEHFDLGHEIVRRRWGDCDDWAPMLSAQLRATGEDPGARTRLKKTGANRWHALTELSDGTILDPSRWAGMGRRSSPTNNGVHGVVARPFARVNGGALAVVPHAGEWWARCDVPFADADAHLASHGRARTPERALDIAVDGALRCGEQLQSPQLERAHAAASMLMSDVSELLDTEDDESEVGSIFGKIFHTITHPKELLKGPAGMVLNPAMALGYHTLHDKQFAGARNLASQVVPGGGMLANAPGMLDSLTSLHALAHGGGSARVPGAMLDPSGSGAVSVPLEHGDDTPQHMMLYYHPHGAPGPVVMRF